MNSISKYMPNSISKYMPNSSRAQYAGSDTVVWKKESNKDKFMSSSTTSSSYLNLFNSQSSSTGIHHGTTINSTYNTTIDTVDDDEIFRWLTKEERKKRFSARNVDFYMDPQDNYVGCISKIFLKSGYDCRIVLPDGQAVEIDEQGKYKLAGDVIGCDGEITVKKGKTSEVHMPDGSKISIDVNGNFKIDDSEAKVVYKANNIRDFNRYINASDLLEEFVEFLSTLKISQKEFSELPIIHFLNWLIIRAMEVDGDDPSQFPKLEIKRVDKPRCKRTGKFITKEKIMNKFFFHSARDAYEYGLAKGY